MARIGVFVCHCGHNIASTVDVKKVAEYFKNYPGVAYSTDYLYMCSDPGQQMIKDKIKELNLTGIVVAACSPHMHERTFRKAVEESGLNPYLCEMANIREHCSWVHQDREQATKKAIDLIKFMVEKVRFNTPLENIKIPITRKALVIGGGVAGIQTALDIAEGGYDVYLVEKSPSIGGHMAQLSETFPTLDCSQCILTPKMVEAASHPKIHLLTYSEVEKVEGYIGNFKVTVRKKARYVIEDLCTGCGTCWEKCPIKKIPSEFDVGMGKRTAIYVPFPQAVPNVPVIDPEHCTMLKKGKCGLCAKVCPKDAIDFKQKDELITLDIGAIVVATGYELLPNDFYPEYGQGRYPDVINGLQFERLLNASGPTQGQVRRPSDGKVPKTVVFIKCVGSRDPAKGFTYCSKICCMYTAKHTMLYKHLVPDGQAIVFYMDIRAGGKNYEEFVRRAIEEEGALYLRGRVSRIYQDGDKLIVQGADTLSGKKVEVEADLVVLASAIRPSKDIDKLASMLNITKDEFGFLTEAHPKLRPVETNTAGIFLAGACQAPKDIPDSVAQGTAAAGKVLGLFSKPELERAPVVAHVNQNLCVACGDCERMCPYNAISLVELKDRKGNVIKIASQVNEGLCQGCGVCVVACRSGCIDLNGFADEQIYGEILALL